MRKIIQYPRRSVVRSSGFVNHDLFKCHLCIYHADNELAMMIRRRQRLGERNAIFVSLHTLTQRTKQLYYSLHQPARCGAVSAACYWSVLTYCSPSAKRTNVELRLHLVAASEKLLINLFTPQVENGHRHSGRLTFRKIHRGTGNSGRCL